MLMPPGKDKTLGGGSNFCSFFGEILKSLFHSEHLNGYK